MTMMKRNMTITKGQDARRGTKIRLMALLMGCLVALPAAAQNRIDELVENFSTTGSAKFTSAVERDPKTRRVQKAVKVLEIRGTQADRFREAFKAESLSGNYSQQQDGDELTATLTCESKAELRLYMLQTVGRLVPRSAKVTIIVKKK